MKTSSVDTGLCVATNSWSRAQCDAVLHVVSHSRGTPALSELDRRAIGSRTLQAAVPRDGAGPDREICHGDVDWLQTLGMRVLPPAWQRFLPWQEAIRVSCVGPGLQPGTKCLAWPIIPGHPESAWVRLPDGSCVKARRIAGGQYMTNPGLGGGARSSLNYTPALSCQDLVVNDQDGLGGNEEVRTTLYLPAGMLEHGFDVLLKDPGPLVREKWKGVLAQVWANLPALNWTRTSGGYAQGTVTMSEPKDDWLDSYEVDMFFKDDGMGSPPSRIPQSCRVAYLRIGKGGEIGQSFVMDEDEWLRDVLRDAGMKVPGDEIVWRIPGVNKIVMFDADTPTHEDTSLPKELRDRMEGEVREKNEPNDREGPCRPSALRAHALGRLTDGGAWDHRLEEGIYAFKFRWGSARFDARYEVRGVGASAVADEGVAHEVTWLEISYHDHPVVSSGTKTLWTHDSFMKEAAKHRWCDDMKAETARALVSFMNLAWVRKFDEIAEALRPALLAGRREVFEAVCRVYESGLDINDTDAVGNTCLYSMALASHPDANAQPWNDESSKTGSTWVALSERFSRAIGLGADPFLKNHAGQSALDQAASGGYMKDLLRGIGPVLSAEDLDRLLKWKAVDGRNSLAILAGEGGNAVAEFRKLLALEQFGAFKPKTDFEVEASETDAWHALQGKVRHDWGGLLIGPQVAAVARFMKVAGLATARAGEVRVRLPLALATGPRPLFEAAWAVYASGAVDIDDRNGAGESCLHYLPLPPSASDGEPVGTQERLAVMLQLGVDPFRKSEGAIRRSAYGALADASFHEATVPLERLRRGLVIHAQHVDHQRIKAFWHSSSPEAVDFFQDLTQGLDYPGTIEALVAPILGSASAVDRWLRRNPSILQHIIGSHGTVNVVRNVPADVLRTYIDAVLSRREFDPGYTGNVQADVRTLLKWTRPVDRPLSEGLPLGLKPEPCMTLFNHSASAECAQMLLAARMAARDGDTELEWEQWCDIEWTYLLQSINSPPPKQSVPTMKLAAILLAHGIEPDEELLSRPSMLQRWNRVRGYWLCEKIVRGERKIDSIDSLSKEEWSRLAPHAHRWAVELSDEKFRPYMLHLMDYVGRRSLCDKETRIAFLNAAPRGRQALDKALEREESEQMNLRSAAWDVMVGRIAHTFFNGEQGESSMLAAEVRDFVAEQLRKFLE